MYFTSLPNDKEPGFDKQAHFNQFKKHNIIFNALASKSYCDDHVGCLSFKTVLSGEEWYGINNQQKAVRSGQFLILNNDQNYSSRIDTDEKVRSLSIFFRRDFASSVFHNALSSNETLLNDPFYSINTTPDFFQTLYTFDSTLQQELTSLVSMLDRAGYNNNVVDEHLIFLLHHLIRVHKSEVHRVNKVGALKPSTRIEIYKRLCIAKDLLHSTFMNKLDLSTISNTAYLSTPQLVRQFKAAFQITPHQYLIKIRLAHAASLLKQTNKSVQEITCACGFEDTSAFCRAFKTKHRISPLSFRALN